jgi:diguanylate cyclase (GGDEF)-like protein
VAVVFVDLDDFKTINDSLGHPAGDHLLVAVADRLRAAVRAEDLVARLGGDEFAILLEGVTEEHAMDVARRILALAAEPVMVGDREVRAGASVGVAFARDGDGPDELLRNADLAMYVAKRSGRGCHRVYVDDMHDAALRRLEVDSELRGAAAKGELEVHYQPVVHLVDGTLTGFEALVRWRHPTRGLLAPGEFLPIAEETGSVDEVGWYVLERACGEASSWPAGPSGADLPVTVNLAVRQLLDDHLPERIARLLDGVGLDPGRLVLEVTEGGLMQDPEAMTRRLSALHGLGVRLAIDDFGTGYSSLAQLRRFPVDVLKLDRLFVLGVEDADGRAVARAVVELAGALGLEAVAEGVETAGQRSALLDLGCVLAQGHLFAAALPPGEVEALIGAGGVVLDGAAGVVAGLA